MVFLPLIAPCAAQTRIALEGYAVVHHQEGMVPQATVFLQQNIARKVNVFGSGRAERIRNDNRGDTVGRLSYGITPQLQFGISAGMQRRVAMLMAYQNEKTKAKAFGLFENRAQASRHVAQASYPILPIASISFLSETHYGIGPRIGVDVGPVTIWYALLREIKVGNTNHVVGIIYEHEGIPFLRRKH